MSFPRKWKSIQTTWIPDQAGNDKSSSSRKTQENKSYCCDNFTVGERFYPDLVQFRASIQKVGMVTDLFNVVVGIYQEDGTGIKCTSRDRDECGHCLLQAYCPRPSGTDKPLHRNSIPRELIKVKLSEFPLRIVIRHGKETLEVMDKLAFATKQAENVGSAEKDWSPIWDILSEGHDAEITIGQDGSLIFQDLSMSKQNEKITH